MSDDQREAVIRYLKKVYPGVAVKNWFKKCQLQLERFLKAEEEPENSDRHFVNEGFAKCQLFSKSGNIHVHVLIY